MTDLDPTLAELAHRCGVAAEYHDWTGRSVPVPEHTLVAVLGALGLPAETADERALALVEHKRRHWAKAMPPTIVGQAGAETSFWVHVTHGDAAHVWVRLEDGTVRSGVRQLDNFTPPFDLDGRLVGEATFALPADLPLGYHRVHLRSGDLETSTALIVAPTWLGLPASMGNRRLWGMATQLYSVRSKRSWGVGDLTDLTDLAVWSAATHGAGYVLVNPLHAAAPTKPMEPSPYLPTSRRFVNPLYLRVEAIPEYADLRGRSRIGALRDDVRKHARKLDSIDRDASWEAKRRALRMVHRVERSAGRELAYAAYRAREGAALDNFATWCALAERYGSDWHQWPADLQHPSGSGIAKFVERRASAVDFHRWLQWQLDEQLAAAQSASVRAGMPLGIMHDLAVGVHPNGADSWALQDVLALGVTAGAPPDEYNQLGQNWSQPPWRPDQLEEHEYLPFRTLIQAVLRHAGGCGSTTSSGCSGCGGFRRAPCPLRAPT
jgi:4-alpha-glucanotransferase